MKSTLPKTLLAIPLALWITLGTQSIQAASDIDVVQAQKLNLQGALLLDVREPSEYSEAHAPNALLIPLGQLSSRINEISAYKDKPIAVMCRTGRRSGKAVQILQNAGYAQATNVSGGIVAWEKAGLEEIRSTN